MSWVTARTGAVLDVPPGVAELALRRNPRRAHLLVSLLLGKHVPVPGDTVLRAAADLGARVRDAVGPEARPYVVGFAETATALGHGVAAALGPAPYAHTTRRALPAGVVPLHFEEEHSHAVEQSLGVRDDELLREPDRPLVLVDDELSSGRTAVNAVRVLQARWPRSRYVLASLLDVRTPEQRVATAAAVADLGAELVDVALVDGCVHLPPDLTERAAVLTAEPDPAAPPRAPGTVRRQVLHVGGPTTGAFGWCAEDEAALRSATRRLADDLRPSLPGRVLVLGDEECMYAAQLTAAALGALTSSTTRSPALVVDEPGYPLRSVLTFPSTDDAGRTARAYNVRDVDHVVLVTDRPVRDELAAALAGAVPDVTLVVLQ